MRKILRLPLALALPLLLASGCTEQQPATNPSNVKRVDPLAEAGGQEGTSPANHGKQSLRRNWYFIIDGSGSMDSWRLNTSNADKGGFDSPMSGAKWAVLQTVENLPPDVNLGLYVFDWNGQREVVQLAPGNKEEFVAAVKAINSGGGTPLGAGIAAGVKALVKQYQEQLGYGEYRLFVVTDGDATDNLNYGVTEAARYTIPIYTIGFAVPEGHALRQYSVSFKTAANVSELKEALKEATSELEVFEPEPPDFQQKE